MNRSMIIAVDGPSASGKSTVAELLAKELDFLYFDTGVMYRAVTLAAMTRLGAVNNEQDVTALSEAVQIEVTQPSVSDGRLYDVLLNGADVTWAIRSKDVEANVSQVSAYPGVRKAMTEQQRKIGRRGNVIMVGRDIGTVVFPEADVKLYLIASVEERARRRFVENTKRGVESRYEDILNAMVRRDQIDSTRTVAPARPAEDAIIVDTDNMTREDVVEKVKVILDEAFPGLLKGPSEEK